MNFNLWKAQVSHMCLLTCANVLCVDVEKEVKNGKSTYTPVVLTLDACE